MQWVQTNTILISLLKPYCLLAPSGASGQARCPGACGARAHAHLLPPSKLWTGVPGLSCGGTEPQQHKQQLGWSLAALLRMARSLQFCARGHHPAHPGMTTPLLAPQAGLLFPACNPKRLPPPNLPRGFRVGYYTWSYKP